VNADDLSLVGHGGEPGAHARAARRTAGDATFAHGIRRRHDHDHTVAHRFGDAARAIDDALVAEAFVLLGSAEPLA